MSLEFTVPAVAEMFEVLSDLVYLKFQNEDTLWDAWSDAALAASDVEDTAAAAKFSGRALTFAFSMKFIPGWITDPAYVKKWSGACLKDHSSGMGGFCMMETNDSAAEATSSTTSNLYGFSGELTTVIDQETGKDVLTYRLSATDFDGFEDAWNTVAYQETSDEFNEQDGRVYHNYVDAISGSYMDVTDSTLIEYLDYPKCAKAADDDEIWQCQMYLPLRDQQVPGYARFDYPGVVSVYQFSSYIPDQEQLSLIKTTSLLSAETTETGATSVTAYATIVVAAIAALAL